MPPKNKSKTSSLVQFWAKQQEDEKRKAEKRVLQTDEVITLSDSPDWFPSQTTSDCSAPKPKQVRSTGPATPVWAPSLRRTSSLGAQPKKANVVVASDGADLNPEESSQEVLESLAYDPLTGTSIQYPISEFIRDYEVQFVKSCLSLNTCLSLPCSISASHVVAVTFANFLRWFPRSRSVYCCSSLEAAEQFKARCIAVGYKEHEISVVHTYQNFKKLSDNTIGNVVITTPQCLTKMVESHAPFLSELRCLALSLDAGEPATKYKKIVGPLIAEKLIYRILVTIPAVPDGSKRTSSITKRQQLITSLHISQWEQPAATESAFRNFAVPLGICTEYWKDIDVSSTNSNLIERWSEGFAPLLVELSSQLHLPSSIPVHLIHMNWSVIIESARALDRSVLELACNCSVLCEALRHLLLHGPRSFYLFFSGILSDTSSTSRAESIQLIILSNKQLSRVFDEVQREFSYNQDSSFNLSFDERSLKSHVKFRMLRTAVEKYISKPGRVNGVVLCSSTVLGRLVFEALNQKVSYQLILATNPDEDIPTKFKGQTRPINRMSGIFFQSTSVVLVLCLDVVGVEAAIDTACSNGLQFVISIDRRSVCLLESHVGDQLAILSDKYEKLRDCDGRLLREEDERAVGRNSLSGRVGAVDRYDFKFEPSQLRLDASTRELQQVVLAAPNIIQMTHGTKEQQPEIVVRQGFELTSTEHAAYLKRTEGCEPPRRGIFCQKKLSILSDNVDDVRELVPDQLFSASFPLGEVGSSLLSNRLSEYMAPGRLSEIRKKKKYRYSEEAIDKERIEKYQQVLRKLDVLLAMN